MADMQTPPASTSSEIVVRVDNISKRFGRIHAIRNISFDLHRGEVLGFLGPNGAGKTTTMRILTGFFPPTSGKVLVEGRELFKSPEQTKRHIGYLPENVTLYPNMTVSEYLEFVAKLRGVGWKQRKKEVDQKLGLCGLGDVSRRLIGHLSKGFRQRTGLAQALIADPKLLVLDEPTTGLDPNQIIEIRNLIRDLGRQRTVILSTHILPEVSMLCHRVLIVNEGLLVASGTPQELEQGLTDRQEIFVSIGDAGRRDHALDLLKQLEGAEDVKVLEENAYQVKLSLSANKNNDLRPLITKLFVEQQIPLLEIHTGRLTLEDIFIKLVRNETQERAAS